jgi:acyl-coenzyme A synthetase/AMP-(fatty) acid ligase
MNLFFTDSLVGESVAWDLLFSDLNSVDHFNPYCFDKDYYSVFKQIITALLLGEEIILLDADFSQAELEKLTGYSDFTGFTRLIEFTSKIRISSTAELISQIRKQKDKSRITLFTSGTTGTPKKVSHSFESITRFVKVSEKNSNDIWGFAYNPTHMAGIQVFLQALLNGNSLVRLYGLSREEIYHDITTFGVTHISATPTFYRLLLPWEGSIPSIKRLTSGGEKFDTKIAEQLKLIFGNAKITNVYASTEAGTLLASVGDTFIIKPEFEKVIRIESGELLIHQSLMGSSEIRDEWYHTGDLVELVSGTTDRFRFIARNNEMINVGGYKVNPHEVEETIRNIPGIRDVIVYAKSNSVLGNILCCEAVKSDASLDETAVRSLLQTQLQEYKIPRIINFVDTISITRTGKLKRNIP